MDQASLEADNREVDGAMRRFASWLVPQITMDGPLDGDLAQLTPLQYLSNDWGATQVFSHFVPEGLLKIAQHLSWVGGKGKIHQSRRNDRDASPSLDHRERSAVPPGLWYVRSTGTQHESTGLLSTAPPRRNGSRRNVPCLHPAGGCSRARYGAVRGPDPLGVHPKFGGPSFSVRRPSKAVAWCLVFTSRARVDGGFCLPGSDWPTSSSHACFRRTPTVLVAKCAAAPAVRVAGKRGSCSAWRTGKGARARRSRRVTTSPMR